MNNTNSKFAEIEEKLEKGLEACFDSSSFKNYLNCISKFHRYSVNNLLLIAMQCPDATLVAPFNTWKKDFKRNVKKGEKGIQIIVPYKGKKIVETDEKDENGNNIEKERTYMSFGRGYVFDVSQTEGDDLPTICKALDFSVNNFEELKNALLSISPVPVMFDDTGSSAHGYYKPKANLIVVQKDMSEGQTIKTMIHEIAHARLGHGKDGCNLSRNEKELQAESVAYAVSNYLGIDTSDYTFEYLASWSKDRNTKELKAQMGVILDCAKTIIDDIENYKVSEVKLESAV